MRLAHAVTSNQKEEAEEKKLNNHSPN